MERTFIGKEEVISVIQNLIKKHGFDFRMTEYSDMPEILEDHWYRKASIAIENKCDYDNFNIKEVKFKITAQASICSMGGAPTTEELLMAAEEIKNKALLADEINKSNLEYTMVYT